MPQFMLTAFMPVNTIRVVAMHSPGDFGANFLSFIHPIRPITEASF
jgi:hypothetical protein